MALTFGNLCLATQIAVLNHGLGVPVSQSNFEATERSSMETWSHLRTWTVVPSLVFIKETSRVLARCIMRAGEPESCAYHHPKYISPQGVSGAAPNNINRKQQSGHVCDSSLWLTNHIVWHTSFNLPYLKKKAGVGGPFSCSQSSGKWCATLNVSALRHVRWDMYGRAALSPGE